MDKVIRREKVVSVKMSEATYKDFKALAKRLDLMTSTMAYLIIRKYLADKSDQLAPDDLDFFV